MRSPGRPRGCGARAVAAPSGSPPDLCPRPAALPRGVDDSPERAVAPACLPTEALHRGEGDVRMDWSG
eukprot:5036687-Pyramimonas_sp.AAC.1